MRLLKARVEPGQQVQVGLQRRSHSDAFSCFVQGCGQAQHALAGFPAGLAVVPVQPVQACAGVGVNHGECRVFLREVGHQGQQRGVLEHIRVVAGVKGVAVTEHGSDANR